MKLASKRRKEIKTPTRRSLVRVFMLAQDSHKGINAVNPLGTPTRRSLVRVFMLAQDSHKGINAVILYE